MIGPAELAATLVTLKVRLIVNDARSSPWRLAAMLIAAGSAITVALLGVVAVVAARELAVDDAGPLLVLGGGLLALGWALVPLCAFGADETLDVARLVAVPVRARRLVPGLTLAGLVGFPGVATTVVVAATVVTWWRTPASVGLAVAAVGPAVATCALLCRLSTGLAAAALSGRHGRRVLVGMMLLLAGGLAALPVLLAASPVTDWWRAAAQVVGWTPLGLPFAAPADGASGHVLRGVLRLVLAVAVLAGLSLAWAGLIEHRWASGGGGRAVARPHLSRRHQAYPGGAGERFGVIRAVARRTVTYWCRDPRYLAVLVALPLVAAAIVALGRVGHAPAFAYGIGPVLALLVALAAGADLGYDGSAFAAHLLCGVRGADDRAGRLLGALGWSLPVVVVAATAGALIAGPSRFVPVVVGVAGGILVTATAAGAVIGTVLPYPMAAPGTGPFHGAPGGGGAAVVAQTAVCLVAAVVAVPVALAGLAGGALWAPLVWLSVPAAVVVAVAAVFVGVRWGGQVLDDRGPEILAVVRRSL